MGGIQCDPDWAIFTVFGNKLSHKSSPNILVTFWAISNNVTIMLKVCGQLFGEIRQLFIPSTGLTVQNLFHKI